MQCFPGGLMSRSIRQRHILLGGRCFCAAVATLSAATGYNRKQQQSGRYFDAHLQGRRRRMVPWLMISSSTEICHLYDITNTHGRHLPATDVIPLTSLPPIKEVRLSSFRSFFIGSSEGFLISLDPNTGQIHAVDPLTSDHIPNIPSIGDLPWKVHPLSRLSPDGSFRGTAFDARKHPLFFVRCKAVLSPSLDTIVLVSFFGVLFARLGGSSSSPQWSFFPNPIDTVSDCVFHDNRLCCLGYDGSLGIYDLDDPMATPPVAPPGPSEYYRDGDYKRFLVESPDGDDLFYIFRGSGSRPRTRPDDYMDKCHYGFRIFKLSKQVDDDGDINYKWNQVWSIGDSAMFVGTNHSVSLPSCDLPNLMNPNCIYFTHTPVTSLPVTVDANAAAGVYHLENESIQFYKICHSDKILDQLPVWFMPSLP